MGTQVCLRIPGVPAAQPRQRHAVIAGHLHNYTPTRHPANQWKAAVAAAWQAKTDAPPLDGPVWLSVTFVMPRPQRLLTKGKRDQTVLHDHKPDLDNLLKCLKDALKGLAWRDDSQVAQLRACKVYAAADEQPHCELYVDVMHEICNAVV